MKHTKPALRCIARCTQVAGDPGRGGGNRPSPCPSSKRPGAQPVASGVTRHGLLPAATTRRSKSWSNRRQEMVPPTILGARCSCFCVLRPDHRVPMRRLTDRPLEAMPTLRGRGGPRCRTHDPHFRPDSRLGRVLRGGGGTMRRGQCHRPISDRPKAALSPAIYRVLEGEGGRRPPCIGALGMSAAFQTGDSAFVDDVTDFQGPAFRAFGASNEAVFARLLEMTDGSVDERVSETAPLRGRR